jgi:hypothetical protein
MLRLVGHTESPLQANRADQIIAGACAEPSFRTELRPPQQAPAPSFCKRVSVGPSGTRSVKSYQCMLLGAEVGPVEKLLQTENLNVFPRRGSDHPLVLRDLISGSEDSSGDQSQVA